MRRPGKNEPSSRQVPFLYIFCDIKMNLLQQIYDLLARRTRIHLSHLLLLMYSLAARRNKISRSVPLHPLSHYCTRRRLFTVMFMLLVLSKSWQETKFQYGQCQNGLKIVTKKKKKRNQILEDTWTISSSWIWGKTSLTLSTMVRNSDMFGFTEGELFLNRKPDPFLLFLMESEGGIEEPEAWCDGQKLHPASSSEPWEKFSPTEANCLIIIWTPVSPTDLIALDVLGPSIPAFGQGCTQPAESNPAPLHTVKNM